MQTMDSLYIQSPDNLPPMPKFPTYTNHTSGALSLSFKTPMIETDLTEKQEALYKEIEEQIRNQDHPLSCIIQFFHDSFSE